MKNSRIKLDKPDLTDSNILKHKNFNQTYNAFNKASRGASGSSGSAPGSGGSSLLKGLANSLNFWVGVGITGIVATVATVIALNTNNNDPITDNSHATHISDTIITETNAEDFFVRPPLDNINIAWENFDIPADEETEIETSTGSKIVIPGQAFSTVSGKVIQAGNVKVMYREFHNPVDIFLSGIPMTYDTAGVQQHFESAGMLEIHAYHNGEELQLSDSKAIDVEMISYDSDSKFNLYYLDEKVKQWKCEGKDRVQEITETNDDGSIENDMSLKIDDKNVCQDDLPDELKYAQDMNMSTDIIKPKKAGENTHIFNIEIDTEERPEFEDYQNVLFEVAKSDDEFDPKYYDVVWEDATINKSEIAGYYTLSLSRMDTTVNVTVYPVWDEDNYDKAVEQYNDMMKEVKKSRKKRNPGNADYSKKLVNEFLSYNNKTPEATRNFNITRMGIYNCDHPFPLKGKRVYPEFIDADGQYIDYEQIYITFDNENTLVTIPKSREVVIRDDKGTNLWIVTTNGEIAIAREESLRGIKDGMTHTFETDVYNEYDGIRALNETLNTKQNTEEITEPDDSDEMNKLDNKTDINITTYPNPFHDKVTIETEKEASYNLELIDMSGALVRKAKFTGTKFEWTLATIKKGNYVIRVISNDEQITKSLKVIRN